MKRIETSTFLEEQALFRSREKTRLRVDIPQVAVERVSQFLREKGLLNADGIRMLIEYGLSEESEEELKRLKSEMQSRVTRLWGDSATLRRQIGDCITQNYEVTLELPSLLAQNRLLKKRLRDEGLQSLITRDEWDEWDETKIHDFYAKYVFKNRS